MTSTLIDRLHGVSEGVAVKRPCRAATTANISLSGLQVIDGVTLAENDRVLVRSQADPTRNGIYSASTGNWSRSADFDGSRDVVKGTRVSITDGATNASKQFVVTSSDPISIGESAIDFAEITENIIDDDARIPETPVIAIDDDYTVVAANQGSVVNADCTTGNIVVTLLSAGAAGDGFRITIRHVGTGNTVTLAAATGDAIDGKASFALTARYEGVCLVCDGSNWHIDGHARPFMTGSLPFLLIQSRNLTAPPVSPTPGARYVLAGAGGGAWSPYTQGDVLEANGQGGFIRYTPSAGWHGYDSNAGQDIFYDGIAWQGLPNTDDPGISSLRILIAQHTETSGTAGGSATASAFTKRKLNTTRINSITTINGASGDASHDTSASTITLPTGEYLVFFDQSVKGAGLTGNRFVSANDANKFVRGPNINAAGTNTMMLSGSGFISVSAASEAFQLEYYAASNSGSTALGDPVSSGQEVYATVTIIDRASLKGPKGDPGIQGNEGFAGLKFTFSNSTTMGDPGTGTLRLNNAVINLVTEIAIDDTSAGIGNPNVEPIIATWDDSSSTNKGRVRLSKQGATENFAVYDIVALDGNSAETWTKLTVNYVAHAGTFSTGDALAVEFVPKGDKGEVGATGATGATGVTGAPGATGPHSGLDYAFDTGTSDADPGSGKLRFNHATLSSAAFMYISKTGRNNESLGADVGRWDDASAVHRGHIRVFDIADRTKFIEADLTAALTDGTSYWKVPLSNITGGATPVAGAILDVFFSRGGADGAGDLTAAANLSDLASPKTGFDNISVHGTDVVSAATIDLDAANGSLVDVTGTTTITAVTLANGRERTVRFTSALTLTHGASFILPGAANIVTAAGDFAIFRGYSGGVVRCAHYLRAAGRPLNSGVADTIGAVGFSATPFDFATKSTGIFTPDPASGNFQSGINGGAHTLAPPSNSCTIILQYTNNGSAGVITTSGFSKKTGDTITTTNGDDFLFFITKMGSFSHLHVQALQ